MNRALSAAHDIVVRMDTVDHVFNAPAVNPFSDHAMDVLGELAVTRIRRQLLAHPARYRSGARLVIQLPAGQITPGLQAQTRDAVGRYVDAKIADNALTVRLSRRLGGIGLLIVLGVAVGVLGLSSLMLAGPLANASEDVRGLLVAFVGILAWVMLWDPLSKLLFEWVGPRLQNGVLRKIKAMTIEVEPQLEP